MHKEVKSFKKNQGILLILFLFFFFNFCKAAKVEATISPIDLRGEGAVLIEESTGEILFEKNSRKKMYPASTTKIMTALLALEHGNLEEIITVGPEVEGIPDYSNKADLRQGQRLSLHELLYGLMLPSGNDAANTLGVYIAKKATGNENLSQQEAMEVFSKLATQRAKSLGARHTQFKNPHGFHDKDHFTTPLDMAKIAREAMKNAVFREIVKTPTKTYPHEAKQTDKSPWENTNYLIHKNNDQYYPYATGVKTGNTLAAGKCLVSSGTKEGFNVLAVVLKSTNEDIWEDSTKLLSYGLDGFQEHELTKEGCQVIPVEVEQRKKGARQRVNIVAGKTNKIIIPQEEIKRITKEITWTHKAIDPSSLQQIIKLSSPLNKEEKVGEITYYLNGKILGKSPLIVKENLKFSKGPFQRNQSFVLILLGTVILGIIGKMAQRHSQGKG